MLTPPEKNAAWTALSRFVLAATVLATPAAPDDKDAEAPSRPILRMFNHRNYNRDDFAANWEVRLNTSWRDLGHAKNSNGDWIDFKNCMTSYKITKGYTVIFYDDVNYGRELFRVPPKPYEDPEIGEDGNPPSDRVESVRILDPEGREIPDPRQEAR